VTGAYPVLPAGGVRPAHTPARSARTFRGIPASVPEARRFVASVLAGCPAREALVACASELCANAIAHTASGDGGVFTVAVERRRDGMARVAVSDGGGPSVPAAGPFPGSDPMAEGGRGLALVAGSVARWGYTDACPGRTVWAEATWPVPVRSAVGPARRGSWGLRLPDGPPAGPAA
jgi:anti-sigma regulatory factor (Ser/Thr protein kinase)